MTGAPRQNLSLLLTLVSAHQRMGQLVERELAREGVEIADYALLSLIGARGPVRVTEAASELGLPLTTASDAVKRLETRGLIGRDVNPADARSFLVELTPTGDELWRRGWPALRRIDAGLRRELGDGAATRAKLAELSDAFARLLA